MDDKQNEMTAMSTTMMRRGRYTSYVVSYTIYDSRQPVQRERKVVRNSRPVDE